MTQKKKVMFFYNLTRSVMSILLIFTVYILHEVTQMKSSVDYALQYYNAFPAMIENLLIGISIYAIFMLLFIKLTNDRMYDTASGGKK